MFTIYEETQVSNYRLWKNGAGTAQTLKNIEETELVAVQSRNAEKAAATAARFGVKAYSDIAEMIQKEQVQIVVICTPHPPHSVCSSNCHAERRTCFN